MQASAYQKRQTASVKRATKSRTRRIKKAAAIHAARNRRIKARKKHRSEDHDRPMMSANGLRYEMADRNSATCYGGIGLAQVMARQSGLVHAINEHVELLQTHFPYHESDHVLNIAYNAMTDGTYLEDLKRKRADEAYLNALGAKRIPEESGADTSSLRDTMFSRVAQDSLFCDSYPKVRAGRVQSPDHFIVGKNPRP